ncbi:hypothetical protein BGX38DRAFT_1281704 [Terfezia claveryi]|nr:hypothetical protein BGX38DRAFT_1281704 [Terfezia claveryi]
MREEIEKAWPSRMSWEVQIVNPPYLGFDCNQYIPMFSAISATNITAIHWVDKMTADPIDDSDPAETIFDTSSDSCTEEEPNTDNMEYLAYNTTDDEDNNSSDLSSVPASTMDGDNSDDVETDNKSIDNGEDHTQASRLYRQTLDEIFANPNLREVDKVLEDSNDDEEDEDYTGIMSNQIVHQYSRILRESKPKGIAKGKEDSSAKS